MRRDLSRLLQPKSIATVGGGAWCDAVVTRARAIGFDGPIWPVHPSAADIGGEAAVATVADLPTAPDAVFIGVNRQATIPVVADLAKLGAGGAVCFASGFSEATAEDESGGDLEAQLLSAAGDMPLLGPNCYGYINALDGALLWPDQHGCRRVCSGVAILTQSSNISINLTMQQRGLPVAYMVACGNMAQTSQAQIASALLDDARVTAIGLHVEGFGNLREWEALAAKAHDKGVPLAAIKVGASEEAKQATVSHTASLAGSDAGAQALLERLGIARVKTLPAFLETLKLLHLYGPLRNGNIATISCSGGEASLIADSVLDTSLRFPPLTQDQRDQLRAALGPMVALSNPLDYHTYIWRDEDAMTRVWSAMTGGELSMTLSVVDYPTTDPTDWGCATRAAMRVRSETGAAFGVVATLPELLPPDTADALMQAGVVPFNGLDEALTAIDAAHRIGAPSPSPICLPGNAERASDLTETQSKQALAAHGVPTPRNATVTEGEDIAQAIAGMRPTFAVKGVGLAHKSDLGAVRLGVAPEDVARATRDIGTASVLIEEMVEDAVLELLVGVVRDPAHGFVLTLGAGGVLTEVLRDTVSLLIPSDAAAVANALDRLKCAPLLNGYRGRPGADIASVVGAIEAVQSYVIENADTVCEVEINPLLCTPDRAVAVDALIRKA